MIAGVFSFYKENVIPDSPSPEQLRAFKILYSPLLACTDIFQKSATTLIKIHEHYHFSYVAWDACHLNLRCLQVLDMTS